MKKERQSDETIRMVDGKFYKDGVELCTPPGYKWIVADKKSDLYKFAEKNKCKTVYNIQQIETIESYGHSFEPHAIQQIDWKEKYLGFIECSEREIETRVTLRGHDHKDEIVTLQVNDKMGKLSFWYGKRGVYFTTQAPLDEISKEIEEDPYNERFKRC